MSSGLATMTGHRQPAPAAVAAAITAALTEAGTPLLTGVPGGGPNRDLVGAAAGAGLPFVLAHGETAAAIMALTRGAAGRRHADP